MVESRDLCVSAFDYLLFVSCRCQNEERRWCMCERGMWATLVCEVESPKAWIKHRRLQQTSFH